jgi:hypothetical protein
MGKRRGKRNHLKPWRDSICGKKLQQKITSFRLWSFLHSVSVVVSCWRTGRWWLRSYVRSCDCPVLLCGLGLVHTLAIIVSVVSRWLAGSITCAFGLGTPEEHVPCSSRTYQATLPYLQISVFKSIRREFDSRRVGDSALL